MITSMSIDCVSHSCVKSSISICCTENLVTCVHEHTCTDTHTHTHTYTHTHTHTRTHTHSLFLSVTTCEGTTKISKCLESETSLFLSLSLTLTLTVSLSLSLSLSVSRSLSPPLCVKNRRGAATQNYRSLKSEPSSFPSLCMLLHCVAVCCSSQFPSRLLSCAAVTLD